MHVGSCIIAVDISWDACLEYGFERMSPWLRLIVYYLHTRDNVTVTLYCSCEKRMVSRTYSETESIVAPHGPSHSD